ncbi:MAG: hypothetical protein IH946_09760, partial [Bacteroidetes bacterium]|nr:hypothetical protein [Bacteroidota bacterium]
VNNDQSNDFSIWLITVGNGITILTPDTHEILGSAPVTDHQPFALDFGDTIDANQMDWSNNNSGHMQLAPGGNGQWHGVSDKYMGLKVWINGNWHYGWVRMDVSSSGSEFTVKDYAYEDIPDQRITAGALPVFAEAVTMVAGEDVNDLGNGSDLQVSFTKATDETSISAYRIFVVNQSFAPFFTLVDARNNPNYTEVLPTGSNIVTTLSDTAKDHDGDLIANSNTYNIFVMSIADDSIATADILSDSSAGVYLETIASSASNVVVSDINDNGDGSDLNISFNRGLNEATIKKYRIIAVKSQFANNFTVDDALLVPFGSYAEFDPLDNPTMDPIVVNMDAAYTDQDGNSSLK